MDGTLQAVTTASRSVTVSTRRVLIVSPDLLNDPAVCAALDARAVQAVEATSIAAGLAAVDRERFDAVVLDSGLPALDPTAHCRLFLVSAAAPLAFAHSEGCALTTATLLDLGVEAVFARRCDPQEIAARVRAIARHGQSGWSAVTNTALVRAGAWALDFHGGAIIAPGGSRAKLSPQMLATMSLFFAFPGEILGRDRLTSLSANAGEATAPPDWRVRLHRLRQALDRLNQSQPVIRCVRGRGYVFEPDAQV